MPVQILQFAIPPTSVKCNRNLFIHLAAPCKWSLELFGLSKPNCHFPDKYLFYRTGNEPEGCTANDTIQVTVNTQVTVNATGTDSVCLGQSVPLNATGAAIYNWTPAQGLNNPNIANPVSTPDASQIGNAASNVITYS